MEVAVDELGGTNMGLRSSLKAHLWYRLHVYCLGARYLKYGPRKAVPDWFFGIAKNIAEPRQQAVPMCS